MGVFVVCHIYILFFQSFLLHSGESIQLCYVVIILKLNGLGSWNLRYYHRWATRKFMKSWMLYQETFGISPFLLTHEYMSCCFGRILLGTQSWENSRWSPWVSIATHLCSLSSLFSLFYLLVSLKHSCDSLKIEESGAGFFTTKLHHFQILAL